MASKEKVVLVTGTNGGLGLAICERLIDEFLRSKADGTALRIIFTTRSSKKAKDTLAVLHDRLMSLGFETNSPRIKLQPELVDLSQLLSVKALARKLLNSNLPKLDAIVLNAGIGGWVSQDWPRTVYKVCTSLKQATTWPDYKIGMVGLLNTPQFPEGSSFAAKEPLLGQVFCANVFGHYLLAHWLMPLLRACPAESPGRVIWMSSLEPMKRHLRADDLQGFESHVAYENTKRVADFLALTARYRQSKFDAVQNFFTPSESMRIGSRAVNCQPVPLCVHPGIAQSSIVPLDWFQSAGQRSAFFLSRWTGSPWAVVSAYNGANSAVWAVLSSQEDIEAREAEDGGGPGKWGSSVSRGGTESIRRTDTQGYGIIGDGKPFATTWWGGSHGRVIGSVDATAEDVKEFLAAGDQVWREMEAMRVEWETLLDDYERSQKS